MAHPLSLQLKQKQTQSLKQTQRLIMSPQMQQAIHLLQVPIMELSTLVEAELQQNPVLEQAQEDDTPSNQNEEAILEDTKEFAEESEPSHEKEVNFDDHDFEVMRQLDNEFRDHFAESDNYYSKRTADEEKQKAFLEGNLEDVPSLFDHLMRQAREVFETKEEHALAEAIIGNLDERGHFTTPFEEIIVLHHTNEKKLQEILKQIQTFEPFGVGAHDLREALLIQLTCLGKGDTLAYAIIDKHYEDLLHHRIPAIVHGLHSTPQEIQDAVNEDISKLDIRPGAWHSKQTVQSITADVLIRQDGAHLIAEANNESLPSLRFNGKYLRMLEDDSLSPETKEYIKQKVISGKWFLRNLHQRSETLLKIANHLIERQREHLLGPQGKLIPMTMKSVAGVLGLHESTIARAVASKYLSCPRGLVPLRSFFTNAYASQEGADISSRTVKDILLEIVKAEDKKHPLSDEALSHKIEEKGVHCARRTVSKYRQELNIGSSSQRKHFT